MSEEKKNKRNGIIATVVFHTALLILFLFMGLQYYDPPPEEGIAINFGYTPEGAGETEQAETVEEEPTPVETPDVTEPDIPEEVVTQDVDDAPAVSQDKPKDKPKEEPKEKVEEEKPRELSEAEKRLQALKGISNASGEGDTKGGGDQGDPNGDPNSPNRTGTGGTGNSGNYLLRGRLAQNKPKPDYDCQAQGVVVVKIYVNRLGKVTKAEPGSNIKEAKTTTASSCLWDRAKKAALKTTWSKAGVEADEVQVGHIIYDFTKH